MIQKSVEEERLLASIKEPELIEFCQQLVRRKSVNPPGDELPIAEYVASTLEWFGLEVELVRHGPNRASVLARLKGRGTKPGLLYNGHLDTVPVGAQEWIHDPFSAKTAEGKIWGRGAVDMKGGLAALMAAAKALAGARLPLSGDFIMAATAGEETDSQGAMAIAARSDLRPLQAVIIAEPTNNGIYVAEKGALWLELTTHGKTAHGATPELGRNAVMMMWKLIGELEKLEIPHEEHPMLGSFTRSINTIAGGMKTNVVPDNCVVTVDMRTVPGQDHLAILRRIEDLIEDLGRRIPDFKASAKITNDRIPVQTSPEESVVKGVVEIVAEVTGERPVPGGISYYTDGAAFVPALNIPMIICGPGDPKLAHQPNEHVEVSSLVQSARIFTLAAVKLLQ
ncbi:MAG TPA: M20 family metallopeptidase [Thermodesulfobacteriota bacterium]|nr:M20 family metallopeptidase [Thermodesulfobacteriota bacterium]